MELGEAIKWAKDALTRPLLDQGDSAENARCLVFSQAVRALVAAAEAGRWRPIEDGAPKDGTVIEAVGRLLNATAGFPRHAFYQDGKWRGIDGIALVCWAWRPRPAWPAEPLPPAPEA